MSPTFCAVGLIVCLSQSVTGLNNKLVDDEVTWILNLQRPSGTFTQNTRVSYQPAHIGPYVVNLALTNVLRVNTSTSTLSRVKKYLDWYVTHINPDGTMYDWEVTTRNVKVSKNKADSTDSYAATILSLVKSWMDLSKDKNWVIQHRVELRKIADAIWLTYGSNIHLTYALPTYRQAYVMDNVEVWKGLEDYALILAEISDSSSKDYQYRGDLIRNGIYYNLWNSERIEYQVAYNNPPKAVNWTRFYADATANCWPIIFKLPDALVPDRRTAVFQKFKENHLQKWVALETDAFPWVALWEVVKLNESPENGNIILGSFKDNVIRKYYPRRQWTWHIGEAASFAVLLANLNN